MLFISDQLFTINMGKSSNKFLKLGAQIIGMHPKHNASHVLWQSIPLPKGDKTKVYLIVLFQLIVLGVNVRFITNKSGDIARNEFILSLNRSLLLLVEKLTSSYFTTTATLTPGVTYSFKVTARNTVGSSDYSSVIAILAAQIPD